MKAKAALLGLCALLAACAAQAQAVVKMKPGLWETKKHLVKVERDGKDVMEPIPKRAKPNIQRICVTAAMSTGNWNWLVWRGQEEDVSIPPGNCTPAKISHDGNRMTFEITCEKEFIALVEYVKPTPGRSSLKEGVMKMVYRGTTVIAPRQVTTRVKRESVMLEKDATDKPSLLVTESQMKMKFLGDDCGDLQPQDEPAK